MGTPRARVVLGEAQELADDQQSHGALGAHVLGAVIVVGGVLVVLGDQPIASVFVAEPFFFATDWAGDAVAVVSVELRMAELVKEYGRVRHDH